MNNEKRLKELYLASFLEDTKEDADFLFENVFSSANLISKEMDGKTVSMLFLMDCTLKTKAGELPYYYLYAACTDPDYRGKGLMGQLLEKAKTFAKEKGRLGIILKPAKPSLFDFYKKCGFEPFFKVAKAEITKTDLNLTEMAKISHISLENWWEKRQSLLEDFSDCFVSFPKKLFVSAASDCRVATDNKGAYVVYEVREDTLLCKECVFEAGCDDSILEIVATLLKEFDLQKAQLRFPANNSEEIKTIANEQFFSVISSTEGLDAKKPYHGFAFD